jgi:hypothetical protein
MIGRDSPMGLRTLGLLQWRSQRREPCDTNQRLSGDESQGLRIPTPGHVATLKCSRSSNREIFHTLHAELGLSSGFRPPPALSTESGSSPLAHPRSLKRGWENAIGARRATSLTGSTASTGRFGSRTDHVFLCELVSTWSWGVVA